MLQAFVAHTSCVSGVTTCDDTGGTSIDLPGWAWVVFAVIVVGLVVFLVRAAGRRR
jgi:hypothetical protein